MSQMMELLESARRVSVPIVVVRTSDQAATIAKLAKVSLAHPLVQWGAVRGLTGGLNDADPRKDLGAKTLATVVKGEDTINFADAMRAVVALPQYSIVFVHNAQRQLVSSEPGAVAQNVQAIADLRDAFKANFRMLVLLGPAITVPVELEQDVVVIDDELPDDAALRTIVADIYQAGKLAAPDESVLAKAVDALGGLSAFAAEQVAAMSLREHGLDIPALWERKRVAIEQVPGMTVWRGTEKFSDIVGQEALKAHLRRRLNAKSPLGVVVWIDEIDKALANVEGDNTRMYQLLKLLTEMENNGWPGIVAVGIAGGGKSLIAKAIGNEAGVPTIGLDLGATEHKYVGESEENMIRVMQVIKAVGRGRAYFVATSNAATVMRPELQRRFKDGMWMFDLMTADERAAAWAFYEGRYKLQPQQRPVDDAWTGAEIRNCCEYADETRSTLLEAAEIVVPMARSRAAEVEQLRHYAHGKFLDANHGGTYEYTTEPMEAQIKAVRGIALSHEVIEALQDVPKQRMN